MIFEGATILGETAVGLGLAAMLWVTIIAGVEKKKLREIAPQPSGWSESFVQATARYLTKKQTIVLFGCMCTAIVLALASYVLS